MEARAVVAVQIIVLRSQVVLGVVVIHQVHPQVKVMMEELVELVLLLEQVVVVLVVSVRTGRQILEVLVGLVQVAQSQGRQFFVAEAVVVVVLQLQD
jgi:hypothetical protein